MTINGRTFDSRGRTILSVIEDWVTEELHIIFTDGTYLETHGDFCIEGVLDYKRN